MKSIQILLICVLIILFGCALKSMYFDNKKENNSNTESSSQVLSEEQINNSDVKGIWEGSGLKDEYSKVTCTIKLLDGNNATYQFGIKDNNGVSIKGIGGVVSTTYEEKDMEMTNDNNSIKRRCIILHKAGISTENYGDEDYIFTLNSYGHLQGLSADIEGILLNKIN